MLKALLVLPLALAAVSTTTTKVSLKTTSCTATRICYSVVNDGVSSNGSPMLIDYISASASYGRVTASIDGVLWDSGLYAVYPMPLNLRGVDMVDPAGHHMLLSADYTHWTTLNHSGHNYYVQHWRLDAGSLVFQ